MKVATDLAILILLWELEETWQFVADKLDWFCPLRPQILGLGEGSYLSSSCCLY